MFLTWTCSGGKFEEDFVENPYLDMQDQELAAVMTAADLDKNGKASVPPLGFVTVRCIASHVARIMASSAEKGS